MSFHPIAKVNYSQQSYISVLDSLVVSSTKLEQDIKQERKGFDRNEAGVAQSREAAILRHREN